MSAASDSTRRPLIERLVPKSLAARISRQIWGPMLPLANRLSPKLLSRFSGMMDTDDFARAISETSDEQLEAGMSTKLRGVVLEEIVGRMKHEFVPANAGDLDAVIQFDIGAPPEGALDVFQIRIKEKTCEVGKGTPFAETPTSKIEVNSIDFLKMATGNVSGIDLYIGGKLKWDGGMMMLTRLTRIFNIPSPIPTAPGATPAPTTMARA